MTRVLVTGGAGYIGSHTCKQLAREGFEVAVVDNLSRGHRDFVKWGPLIEADIRDTALMREALRWFRPEAVIHFAAFAYVGEATADPGLYYDNNVGGTLVLLEAMRKHGVRRMVFSSSATVYGEPEKLPIPEDHRLGPTNPYGETKRVIENLLRDYSGSDPDFRFAALRYFNPTGAHPSGRIGEDPAGIPNNLFPYIAQVAVGRRKALNVWGRDYATPDGTGVRDYIHVMDLADGHVAALHYLRDKPGSLTVNLGTGRGYSVLEAVQAFERASGRRIPLEFAARRPGDVAACYADAGLAARALGWTTRLSIDEMCRDVWNWQSRNPEGYV